MLISLCNIFIFNFHLNTWLHSWDSKPYNKDNQTKNLQTYLLVWTLVQNSNFELYASMLLNLTCATVFWTFKFHDLCVMKYGNSIDLLQPNCRHVVLECHYFMVYYHLQWLFDIFYRFSWLLWSGYQLFKFHDFSMFSMTATTPGFYMSSLCMLTFKSCFYTIKAVNLLITKAVVPL